LLGVLSSKPTNHPSYEIGPLAASTESRQIDAQTPQASGTSDLIQISAVQAQAHTVTQGTSYG